MLFWCFDIRLRFIVIILTFLAPFPEESKKGEAKAPEQKEEAQPEKKSPHKNVSFPSKEPIDVDAVPKKVTDSTLFVFPIFINILIGF